MSRGQAWSMDLIFGVLIVMLAIGIVYAMLANRSGKDLEPLRIESEVIATKLASDPQFNVAADNRLNMTRIGELAANATRDASEFSYENIRTTLGVKSEFCVYIQDEQGNLYYIRGADGKNYTGIGSASGEMNLSGTPCGCPKECVPAGRPECQTGALPACT